MEHCCHLGAESGLVGAEAAVRVAVDNTNRGCQMIASRAHAPTLAASVKLGTPLTVGEPE